METILYQSNILSKQDVPFINQLTSDLEDYDVKLILTGSNPVSPDWNLLTTYFKIPEQLDYFKNIYPIEKIELDFQKHKLSTTFLLDRFNWWFPEPKNENEKLKRLSFLHFHLHHYLKLIKQNNPSLLLIWNGNDPRQYIISKLGENFGIERLFIERGPLPSVIFYDNKGVLNNSSLSLIDNNKFINGFESYDHSKNYLEWYNSSSEALWKQPKLIGKNNLRDKFGIKNNQKITVFIGQVDNDIQSKLFSPYFSSNIAAFDWFLKNARRDDYFVIGKHHPMSMVSLEKYRDVIGEMENVVWTDEIPLKECLSFADNIVAVNSSVIFEALIYEKPVFTLGDSILSGKEILYEYQPKNYKEELDAFYNVLSFSSKLRNFKNFLELLFHENIVFTRSDLSSLDFIKKITLLKSANKNSDDNFEHDEIVQNYFNNVEISKPIYNNVSSIKKNLKKEFKMVLFKNFFGKIRKLKRLLFALNEIVEQRDKDSKICHGLLMHSTVILNLDKPELIKVGNGCYVGPYAVIYVNNYNDKINNSFLEIGDNTYIGDFSNIRACGGNIKIGSKVQIAQNVNIIASNHMFKKGTPIKDQKWDEKNNFVEIGDDVWIGCGCTLLPGTKIGSGSIIGANSLVKGIIPENVIAVGNPAKVIKERV